MLIRSNLSLTTRKLKQISPYNKRKQQVPEIRGSSSASSQLPLKLQFSRGASEYSELGHGEHLLLTYILSTGQDIHSDKKGIRKIWRKCFVFVSDVLNSAHTHTHTQPPLGIVLGIRKWQTSSGRDRLVTSLQGWTVLMRSLNIPRKSLEIHISSQRSTWSVQKQTNQEY